MQEKSHADDDRDDTDDQCDGGANSLIAAATSVTGDGLVGSAGGCDLGGV
ncbi:MAG: hypothetical protein ACYSOW_11290 [Planctomycetota bacterium]